MVQEASIKVETREPKTKNDFDQYYNLRWRILRQPWDQPHGSEKDDKEQDSIHIMVSDKDKIIGVGRGHFNTKTEAQIRYMAVEEGFQGKGVGIKILEALEKRLIEKGAKTIILNSRKNAVKFYQKHGYKIIGKGHTLFGVIKHFKMRKDL